MLLKVHCLQYSDVVSNFFGLSSQLPALGKTILLDFILLFIYLFEYLFLS